MTGAEAAAVFKTLAKLAKMRESVSDDDFVLMAASAVGKSIPSLKPSPGAIRTRNWRARKAQSEQPLDTLDRHIERHAGDAGTSQETSRCDAHSDASVTSPGEAPSPLDPPDSLNPPQSGSGSGPNSLVLSAPSETGRRRARSKSGAAEWTRFPSDFVPDESHFRLASELGLDLEFELADIRDHEFEKPKKDPGATLRRWLRQASKFRGHGKVNGAAQTSMADRLKARAIAMELEESANESV